MFDTKTLTSSPANARKLLSFAKVKGVNFDEKLVDLAMSDLIDRSSLDGFGETILDNELSTLQHIADWGGRAILMDNGSVRLRKVAMANAWLNKGKTLILAKPDACGIWARLILQKFPDAKISMFGNKQYAPKDLNLPDEVKFTNEPDREAEWFITGYSGVLWHDLFKYVSIEQTIVEELDSLWAINHKWDKQVKALFKEVPRPLFLQNVLNLPSTSGSDNFTSLGVQGSQALDHLDNLVSNLLLPDIEGIPSLSRFMSNESSAYLKKRKYQSMNPLEVFNLYGVSTHLLDDYSNTNTMIFYDDTFTTAKKHGKHQGTSGIYNLMAMEASVATSLGKSKADVVKDAMEGDMLSQVSLVDLMTPGRANLKSQHIRKVHKVLATTFTRSLFLVENPNIKRAMKLQLGDYVKDYSMESDKNFLYGRFIYPDTTERVPWKNWLDIRPMSNLIVSNQDLINDPDLLKMASYLFLSEFSMNPDDYHTLVELAASHGTKVIVCVTKDSYEEEIFKFLT